jgi:uncharacterized protein (TIGR02145 family)
MEGWHVPTDEEFMLLESFLGMSESEINDVAWRGTNEGSKLAGNSDLWYDGNLKDDYDFGTSGLDVLPAGDRHKDGNSWIGKQSVGKLWSQSANENHENARWLRIIYNHYSQLNRGIFMIFIS